MNQKNPRLYNSRLLNIYLKLLTDRYPDVNITDILTYAGIEYYEILDEGHWFTQKETDLFVERIVQLTSNSNIAREAGRLAAAPGTIGAMRQYVFGLIGPSKVFQGIKKASAQMTLSSVYNSKQLSPSKVELTVTPNEGIEEKPFQCLNRLGFFEAIVEGFNLARPQIEHPECIFEGGECCRYIVSWRQSFSGLAANIRNAFFFFAAFINIICVFFLSPSYIFLLFASSLSIFLLLALFTEISKKQELMRSISIHSDSSEKLMDQITTNSRNTQLVQKMGETLSSKQSIEDVLYEVSQVMKDSLDFDYGTILLANEEKSRLTIRSVFGYNIEQISALRNASFHLDKKESNGPFVRSYHDRKPVVVTSKSDLHGKLSARSQKLVDQLDIESFIACPIVVGNEVLGVLAVNNQTSNRPLLKSDVALLQGIAPTIGVALQNANLIEELHVSFEKTLKILADSIDARDYLTAGHSEVVTEYAAGIAEAMGQSDEYIQMIRIAGLLHDYGKIAVPDSILKKNGRLTPEEREIINTHPAKTQQILNQVPFKGLHKQIPVIAGAHHERWDGEGYPQGLKTYDIPLGARILAVADFFEAITSKRHYRNPMPLETALKLLHESSGNHFDPEVVSAFIEYLEFRDYTLVRPSAEVRQFSAPKGSRRRSPRVEYRTQVSVRQGQRIVSGDIINIGAKGAFIATTDEVKEKASLVLTFALPGTEEYVQTAGEVCWCNNESNPQNIDHPTGFAVRFCNVTPQIQSLISQFVRCQIAPIKTETTEQQKVMNQNE